MPAGAWSAIGVSNPSYRTDPGSALSARCYRSVGSASGPQQAVADCLFERVPGGGDDVLVHPDGGPGVAGAVARLDQDPGDRPGAGAAFQDADLEVGQLQGGELGEGLLERGPQRPVERVHRAVALADGDDPLSLGDQPDRRLAGHGAVFSLLDDHPPGFDGEVPPPLARQLVAEQQLEARVGGLERITARLELLDLVGDPADDVLASGQAAPELA